MVIRREEGQEERDEMKEFLMRKELDERKGMLSVRDREVWSELI